MQAKAEQTKLEILFQDEHLVAINKPSGLLVHRSAIDKYETQFAMQIVRDQIGQHVYPVHRLDKPTSGVLVFALNPQIATLMGSIFSSHQLKKTYIAIVRGIAPEHLLLDYALTEEHDSYTDKKASAPEAKKAVTEFFRLADIELSNRIDKYPSSRYSLVKCIPQTGRKHQIRRHLKHLSHPIIGDAKHGKGNHNRFFQTNFNSNRLLLAATELKFIHPVTGKDLIFTARLDDTMNRLIYNFGWHNTLPQSWVGIDLTMRLDKFIGNNTGLSRSQITVAAKQGFITVNNVIVTSSGLQVTSSDSITVHGDTVIQRQPRYLMLNKPAGYVSANTDSEHPTLLDLVSLPFKNELQIAGRLDVDTTGLVLLTDDGQWNHKITSPKHNHTKCYLVTTANPIEMSAVSIFAEGVLLNNEKKITLPADLKIMGSHVARLTICEGKYHQVKRMFSAIGNRVIALHRERIGDIVLPLDLESGHYRHLTTDEITSIEKF